MVQKITARLATVGGAFLALSACNNPAFFDGFETLVIDASVLDPDTAHPVLGNYVQSEYWIDYGEPPADELAALQPAGAEPAMMTPWVDRDSLEVSLQWRVTNDSDAPIVAWVLFDGSTEFFDWNPVVLYGLGGGEDADEIPFPSLLGFSPRVMEPRETIAGEFREDDMREAALDLDTLSRFCGGPLAVIYNRSEQDPSGTELVPPDAVIAGFAMLRLTLAANGPAHLDYSFRIRDRDELLFDATEDDRRYETMPLPYVPTGFAQVPAGSVDPGVTSVYCGG